MLQDVKLLKILFYLKNIFFNDVYKDYMSGNILSFAARFNTNE